MKLTLEQCIQFLLYRDKNLVLPGLGILTVQRKPARFSDDRSVLHAPEFTLDFQEKDLPPHFSLPAEYAASYENHAKYIKNEILSQGKSALFGLGHLHFNGEKVVFVPDQEHINSIWGKLPDINPIAEVPRSYAQSENYIPPVQMGTLVDKKTRNYNWLIKFGWLLVAGIVVYFAFFHHWPIDDNGVRTEGSPKDTAAVNIKDSSGSMGVTGISNEKDSSEQVYIKDTVAREQPNTEIKKSAKSELSENETKNKEVSKGKASDKTVVSGQEYDFIIITGSFKQMKYADNMENKLRSSGYQTYRADNDSTTRIGIRLFCSEKEMQNVLAKIRKTVNKDAWILK